MIASAATRNDVVATPRNDVMATPRNDVMATPRNDVVATPRNDVVKIAWSNARNDVRKRVSCRMMLSRIIERTSE